MKELYQRIKSFSGKNYGNYRQLANKKLDFGDFTLEFLHIQGDPYAPPSKILLSAPLNSLGWNHEYISNITRQIAFSDYLHRELASAVQNRYPEKNAPLTLSMPGQEILIRNSLWCDNGNISLILQIALPGEKRLIDSEKAQEILLSALPDILTSALYASQEKIKEAKSAIENLEIREELLCELERHHLIAFIPNGAILPRESGISEKPLANAIPFVSPKELCIELDCFGKKIIGMGIPKGITVITGGAYHGKSTLLNALEKAVYPHIAHDGREWIVVSKDAVRIRTEEGRSVRHSDISLLVHDLPHGKETKDFSTLHASGSTSEAANLLEMLEFGARTFLIDEDSSAVNFLIRDSRVRHLVGNEKEPLVPLIDQIQNFSKSGCNFILVAGACGDYLEIADTVLLLTEYQVENVTEKAKSFSQTNAPEFSSTENEKVQEFLQRPSRNFKTYSEELRPALKPHSAVERQIKVKLQGTHLQMGFLQAELSGISQLPDNACSLGAGILLLNMLQNAEEIPSKEMLLKKLEKIERIGFRNIPQGMVREMALPRFLEIAAILLRLRDYNRP